MDLRINDIVVHATGVAQVTAIETMYGKQVYKLRMLGTDTIRTGVIVYVPEDKINDVLRPVMDTASAQAVLTAIEQHEERERKTSTWKAVNTLLREMATEPTHDKLAEAFLSYYRKRRSIFEDQFFTQISQRLIPELACALGKSLDEITRTIQPHIRRYET